MTERALLPFDEGNGLPGYPCAWSPCRRYRYALWRRWGPGSKAAMFIGLNPSTADETQDDPTIRRCKAFAKSWGCDVMVMANLFAWRATDPREMKAAEDPIGPDNDEWLSRLAEIADIRIAAWGVHGGYRGRNGEVTRLLNRAAALRSLGRTSQGDPRHPLYLPATAALEPWP